MNYRIIILSLCLATLMACRKHKDPEPYNGRCPIVELHKLDDSLMQFFLFNHGSYWIYVDSASASIDSVYCYGPSIIKGQYMIGPSGPGQGACFHNYTYISDSINHPKLSPYKYYIQDRFLSLVEPYGFASVFLCANINGKLTGGTHHANITIHSQLYSDVYELPFESSHWLYRKGTYYMKPGLGIIKTVLYSGFPLQRKVLELVRYKIM